MTSASLDELAPVDYVVVEFPAGASNFTGEMVAELRALIDSGTIRVIDVLILTKDADGTVEATELSDVGEFGELQAIEAELAELLAADDVDHSPPRWSREPLPGCSSGRTCGPRRSQQRRGVRQAAIILSLAGPARASKSGSPVTRMNWVYRAVLKTGSGSALERST